MPKVSTTYMTLSPVALPMDMYMSSVRPTRTAVVASILPQLTCDVSGVLTKVAGVGADLLQLVGDVAGKVTHKATVDATFPMLTAALYEVAPEGAGEGPARIGDPHRHAISRGGL